MGGVQEKLPLHYLLYNSFLPQPKLHYSASIEGGKNGVLPPNVGIFNHSIFWVLIAAWMEKEVIIFCVYY